jgi:hypothetical protein
MRGASLSSWRTRLRSISSALVARSRWCNTSSQDSIEKVVLDEASGVGDVLIDAPRIGAVALSRIQQDGRCDAAAGQLGGRFASHPSFAGYYCFQELCNRIFNVF